MKLRYPQRIEKIKEYLLEGLSYDEIATRLKVTKRTVFRDLKKWRETGDFETWIIQEFMRLHEKMRTEEPTKFYMVFSRFFEKVMHMRQRADLTVQKQAPEPVEITAWGLQPGTHVTPDGQVLIFKPVDPNDLEERACWDPRAREELDRRTQAKYGEAIEEIVETETKNKTLGELTEETQNMDGLVKTVSEAQKRNEREEKKKLLKPPRVTKATKNACMHLAWLLLFSFCERRCILQPQ